MIQRPPAPAFRLVAPHAPHAVVLVPDEAQRRVLEHERGSLLVLGGPGTGKSATLIEAAGRRVDQGVPVGQLLVLSLTPATAEQLRRQLSQRLGRIVSDPVARTPYSYAYGLLRRAAVAAGGPSPRLLSAAERDLVLRELLAGRAEAGTDRWPVELAAARGTRAFVEELSDLLTRAAERDIDAVTLADWGRRYRRPEWIAAAGLLDEYLEVTALQKPGAFDAPELIQRAIGLLRGDDRLLAAERARVRRLFVDEFADFDPAQRELVGLLGAGADEVLVFSDPSQSVHAFRGADPQSTLGLPARADDQTVLLETSHRAGGELVSGAQRVAARLSGPATTRQFFAAEQAPPGGLPIGADGTAAPVSVAVFASDGAEAAHITRVLRRAHLEAGLAWSDMAVLVRSTGAGAALLRRHLLQSGVPVGWQQSGSLGSEPIVMLLTAIIRCALRPDDVTDDEVEALLCSPLAGADPLQVQSLRHRLHQAGQVPGTLAATLIEPGMVALAGPVLQPNVQRLRALVEVAAQAGDQPASDLLWAVWARSGLATRLETASANGGVEGARADHDLDVMLELFDEATNLSERQPGGDALALLEWLAQLEITDRAADPGRNRDHDAVSLLSVHAAKGREWSLVCVAGVQEGTWPNSTLRGTLLGSDLVVDLAAGRAPGSVDRLRERVMEERRLFYVAVTRARRQLVVTAVSAEDSAPSRFLDDLDPCDGERPVRLREPQFDLTGLVGSLRAVLLDPAVPATRRADAASELARLQAAGVLNADPDRWWASLAPSTDAPVVAADHEVRLSPSHVQTYLDCQMRALLEDLSATDGRQVVEAGVGTLVHEIAELADDNASLAELEAMADERWSDVEFVAVWQAGSERARASRMLAKLAQWLSERRGRLTLLEKEKPFSVMVGDVRLTGRIDRVERDTDGGLIVIDLKATKRSFTKAEVEAHTQLAVYQLAVTEGALGDGEVPGGALLVHLGKQSATSPELAQKALPEQDDPERLPRELQRIGADLRTSLVLATEYKGCEMCPVKWSCPVQDEGRHVVGYSA